MEGRNSLPGVASSLGASVLFATLYYYTTLLEPLTGQQIYGWRILFTAPCLALLLLGLGRALRRQELSCINQVRLDPLA